MSKLQRIENLFLFLTLLFLPTQLGKHFWPPFSFVYSLPIDYLSPTLYFWDLLVAFLWIVVILRKKHINTKALNLLLFFIFAQTLSLLPNSSNLGVGLIRLEQYLIAGLFGVYIASVGFKKEIFWGLVLSIFGESILALAQFIRGETIGLWIIGERTFSLSTPGIAKFDYHGIQFLRPYATFPHPNVLSAFLLVAALILRKKVTSALAVIVTILTVSRTGLIAAAMLFKNKKMLALVILIVLPVLYTRFLSLLSFDSLTLIRREQLSWVALNLWIKSPILGKGLNNFIPVASDLLLSGPSRFLQPVHNILLLALVETGILGLLGWVGLFVYPIKKMKLVWAVIIFLGMFDHYLLTLPQGYRLLFLVWGLSLNKQSSKL